ncbi:hypothetical protein [Streptomyces fuscichromogenes]|uniref:Uncharacterized protein n=1 Tax=Streptomyces fuscichromogenes TaxID=1324013 RepID=A0A917XJ96_9ACTN|nr:hypothetical protein [Streptomyces fuscichromogenes]GGN30455.1 hypothetical protein GCM10011578_067580 [Streptomyces fuscichromogenes]
MNAALPEAETPEPKPAVRWEAHEHRDAEYARLLIMLFGPKVTECLDPGNGSVPDAEIRDSPPPRKPHV